MIRTPIWDITIDGQSIDEWGLRPLMDKISYDSEVGKFDTMEVDFLYGREMADAHLLLKHGAVVELFLGYKNEPYRRMMLGFIKGVKVRGSSKKVTLKIAGYLAGLGKGEKERSLSGKTVEQALNIILSDYDSLVAGTVMNGDQLINEDMTQTQQSDLEFLEGIAEMFGMFLKLEPSESAGVWAISMYELGFESEVQLRPYVMHPFHSQQNPDSHGHLEDFDPESNILGTDISVDVVSVNPIYRYSTSWVASDVGQDDGAAHSPASQFVSTHPNEIYFGGILLGTGPPEFADLDLANFSPMGSDILDHEELLLGISPEPADALYVARQDPLFPDGIPYAIGLDQETPICEPNPAYQTSLVPVQTRTVSGSYVVFECFGGISRVEFQENVSNEEAQQRIAEAILEGKGFNFVSVKGAKLNEGDPDLMIGQRRAITLNKYPLFGEAFSGEYLITSVSHTLSRSEGFETTFDGNANSLTIPPRPVSMATPVGGACFEEGPVWVIHPGMGPLSPLEMARMTAQVARNEDGEFVFDYSAQLESMENLEAQSEVVYPPPAGNPMSSLSPDFDLYGTPSASGLGDTWLRAV